jgi:hypothetical protein
MGLSTKTPSPVSLKIGERKEIELKVNASNTARLGHHTVSLYASSDNIREKTTIPLIITERKFSLLSLTTFDLFALKQPLLLCLSVAAVGCVIGIWIGNRRKKALDAFQLSEDL